MKKFSIQLAVAIVVTFSNLSNAQDWINPLPPATSPWNPNTGGPVGTGNSQPALDMATPWSLGGNSIYGLGSNQGSIPNFFETGYKTTSIGTVDDAPFIMKANNLECIYISPGGQVGLGEGNTNGGAPVDIWAKGKSTNDLSRLSFFVDDRGHIESSVDMTMLFGSGATRKFQVREGSVLGGSIPRITVLSGGNCGINAALPQSALDIRAATNGANFRIYGDAAGNVESTVDMKLHYGVNGNFELNHGAPGSAATRLFLNVFGAHINTAGTFNGLFIGPDNSPWYNDCASTRLWLDAQTQRGLAIVGSSGNNPLIIYNGNGADRFRMVINGTSSGEDTEFDVRGRMQLGFVNHPSTVLKDATARLNVDADALGTGVKVSTGDHNAKALRVELSNPNSNDMFVVYGDGRTRIGPSAPSNTGVAAGAMLTVDGMILARDIRVSNSSGSHWPDYVFDKGYKIMPLEEVEKYVQKNKHLPDVPSEAEVKEEGVDVTSMNIALLKKIEELTLYMIDLNKESEGLKTEVRSLKNRNK